MFLGTLLLAASLLLLAYNRREDARAGAEAAAGLQEVLAEIARQETAAGGEALTSGDGADKAEAADGPGEESGEPSGEADASPADGSAGYLGYLSVPVLGLTLPVLESWSYPALRTAPCRYAGSPEDQDLVIVGHNYSRHFGRLSALREGDLVIFTDLSGARSVWPVDAVLTLEPTDVAEAIDGTYALTLLTCTPGGAGRVAVRCGRK